MYMYNVAHCIGYMYSSSLSVFVWHRLEKLWRRLASPKQQSGSKLKFILNILLRQYPNRPDLHFVDPGF